MKTKNVLVGLCLLATAAGLAFSGCKTQTTVTTNPDGTTSTNTTQVPDTARIASVSKQAATIGTTEVLTAHPEWLSQFQTAEADLQQLATSPTISLDNLLAIVQRLPVKELQSQEARLSFEGATLLISAIDVPELPADQLAELQPIAKAIADGIAAGIAATPLPAK